VAISLDQDSGEIATVLRIWWHRQLNAFQENDQGGKPLLTIDNIVDPVLGRANDLGFWRSVTHDGRHEVMLIVALSRQFYGGPHCQDSKSVILS
jgi:hypothetical protein